MSRVMSALSRAELVKRLAVQAHRRKPEMIERLRALVEIESPSDDKGAVDDAGALVAEWAEKLGGRVRVHRFARHGNSLEIRFQTDRREREPILLLGHLDTVWKKGTLRHMPWRMDSRCIAGPGVLDMKAGVAMMFTALEILGAAEAAHAPVVILLHGDEEIGSPSSRLLTERIAKMCQAVYVLEPAQGRGGAYKTARKGVGHYRIAVTGVAAHSGVDFAAGHSAILELGRQIEVLQRITRPDLSITVNPGVIGGGTRSNVIAAEAWMEVDLRVARNRDAVVVDRALRNLRPIDKACTITVKGSLNRPPMERTRDTVALFRRAQKLAAHLSLELEEAATGGGSDGNFTSALRVPTLDGMGAVGEGAHAAHEHIVHAHLPVRTALLAAMLLESVQSGASARESNPERKSNAAKLAGVPDRSSSSPRMYGVGAGSGRCPTPGLCGDRARAAAGDRA